ncbi:MAG: hypothetical protein ACT4PM_02145 [Gemmatimonadales bacterium]
MRPHLGRTIRPVLLLGSVLLGTASCGRRTSDYSCGLAAMAGLSLVVEQFTRPGTTLGAAPATLPDQLPVRIALGPALRSVVGRSDTLLIVGVEGTLPPEPQVGFGVLIVNPQDQAEGVILYEGAPIAGAPRLGTVNLGTRDVPLLGLQIDLRQFENAACPTFPDSLK